MKSLLQSRKALIGLVLLGIFVVLTVVGPWLAPYDPSQTSSAVLQGPSAQHLLGTTQTGQDVLSQLLVGTRDTMLVGITSAVIATALAVIVGITAGYAGGVVDEGLSMVSNIFLVIPALPLVIVLAGYLKSSGWLTVAVVISVTAWSFGARVLRAQTLSLRGRDFVKASRAIGERHWRIVLVEIMPNLGAVIISGFLFTFISAILTESSLAFLGLGSVNEWSWGSILYWAQSAEAFSLGAWWWYIPPGLCVALVGMSLTMINLGADEIINPRLAGTRAPRKSRRTTPATVSAAPQEAQ